MFKGARIPQIYYMVAFRPATPPGKMQKQREVLVWHPVAGQAQAARAWLAQFREKPHSTADGIRKIAGVDGFLASYQRSKKKERKAVNASLTSR